MLAALGWPVAEALNGPLSKLAGLQSTLVEASGTPLIGGDTVGAELLMRNPSFLNGGLESISPIYWGAVLAFGAATEIYATKIQRRAGFRTTMAALGAEELTGMDIDGDGQVGQPKMLAADSYLPGDLGFDPLGLYKGSDKNKASLQLKELNNGRLAMMAIAGYAITESAAKVSILSEGGGVFNVFTTAQ
ncbi:chlorophyll a/b-binding-like protein [Baffinella frigidus]|nr:chlorophyll a/b-binding-like protein [Cryptophyta sp. CCMP2293]